MNRGNHLGFCGFLLLASMTHPCAATLFTNLDFESGGPSDLLPGWSVTSGYEAPFLDAEPLAVSMVGLHSTNLLAIAGSYSGFLSAGVGMFGYPYQEVAMWQSADVPTNATHIEFVTTPLQFGYVSYTFTLGGSNLLARPPEIVAGGYEKYTIPLGDLAGQSATLTFSVLETNEGAFGPGYYHRIDSIAFVAIPEPTVLGLVFLGWAPWAVCLLRLRRIRSV